MARVYADLIRKGRKHLKAYHQKLEQKLKDF